MVPKDAAVSNACQRALNRGEVVKEIWQIVLALTFPIVCLFLVLWLARLEETLTRDVRRSERKPEPPPILRVPAKSKAPAQSQTQAQASDVSRSALASLGGSTNR
jgi:hypothetical protein